MPHDVEASALGRLRTGPYSALQTVSCSYHDRVLELAGHLPSNYLKQIAQSLVSDIEGVTAVVNRIEVTRSTQPPILNRTVQIKNALGLNLRVAERFVTSARPFLAEIRIIYNGRDVNGKSVFEVMRLGAACGSYLELRADGPDADAAWMRWLPSLSTALVSSSDERNRPRCLV
jgi:phosphocarrier protein